MEKLIIDLSESNGRMHKYEVTGDDSEVKKWLEENCRDSGFCSHDSSNKCFGVYSFGPPDYGKYSAITTSHFPPVTIVTCLDMDLPKSLVDKLNLIRKEIKF